MRLRRTPAERAQRKRLKSLKSMRRTTKHGTILSTGPVNREAIVRHLDREIAGVEQGLVALRGERGRKGNVSLEVRAGGRGVPDRVIVEIENKPTPEQVELHRKLGVWAATRAKADQ